MTSNNKEQPLVPIAVVDSVAVLHEHVSLYVAHMRKTHGDDDYMDSLESAMATVRDFIEDRTERCPHCDSPRTEGTGEYYIIPDGQGGITNTWYCSWDHYRRNMKSAGYQFDDNS